MNPILAKSPRDGQKPKTLLQHLQDVMVAARALLGTPENPTRLARRWCAFFRLSEGDVSSLIRAVNAAAVLHDLGKANDHFQAAVHGSRNGQLIRHEHLTGVLLLHEPFWKWLTKRTDIDWDIILSAVVCHHLKAGPENSIGRRGAGSAANGLWVCADHPDLHAVLNFVSAAMGLPGAPPALPAEWIMARTTRPPQESIPNAADRLEDRLVCLERTFSKDDHRQRFLSAVRAALIVADAAGSGLPRQQNNVADWLDDVFSPDERYQSSDIQEKVIAPRIKRLRETNRWNDWSRFQTRTAELPPRALLLAPCGSGKTLAAWRWIATHAESGVGHCLFLYPTRATATEGFRDYVSWAPEDEAALMHGSAAYELEGMFANPEDIDSRSEKRFEPDARLRGLGFWPKRVFSATADQFLAFTQYGYASLCMLPVLADSVVVVDEVHSFDRGMFQALVDFLENFDVPVLCMTATLPKDRRQRLERAGLVVLDAYQEGFPDLRMVAEVPRYTVEMGTADEAKELVERALAEHKKVLWVVNTVARAQELARAHLISGREECLCTARGVPVYCYHSRYRLCDRKERHDEVVKAFQREDQGAVLAITTQVCEMGLDLDADVLVTELAPITALIQRMGRCNRRHKPREGAGTVFVYEGFRERPYEPEELAHAKEFAERLAARSHVNQTALDEELRQAPIRRESPKPQCQFLRSGAFALAGDETFREIEEFTRPAVLDSDLRDVLACLQPQRPIDGYVVQVPKHPEHRCRPGPDTLPAYLVLADSHYYHHLLGFCDEPVTSGDPPPCPSQKPPLIV